MKSIQKRKGVHMNRRDVLKSAGCLLTLPALESFGQEPKGHDAVKANRLFCMNIGNGMCSDNFPMSTGKDYQSSSTFLPLEARGSGSKVRMAKIGVCPRFPSPRQQADLLPRRPAQATQPVRWRGNWGVDCLTFF